MIMQASYILYLLGMAVIAYNYYEQTPSSDMKFTIYYYAFFLCICLYSIPVSMVVFGVIDILTCKEDFDVSVMNGIYVLTVGVLVTVGGIIS
jgi:hypothetical protein